MYSYGKEGSDLGQASVLLQSYPVVSVSQGSSYIEYIQPGYDNAAKLERRLSIVAAWRYSVYLTMSHFPGKPREVHQAYMKFDRMTTITTM